MISTITFFEDSEDLEKLTGLTHDQLWENNFNLDDIDFGIMTETEWTDGWWDNNAPYYQHWLLNNMSNHCVGYEHVAFDDKHYYTVHHS